MQRFENKTILITGGSSGIGLAGARRLVEEGARVIITGRTEERLQAAAAELVISRELRVVGNSCELCLCKRCAPNI